MAVRKAEDFLKEDIDTVCQMLSGDNLRVSTEVEVLSIALEWYSKNSEGRYDTLHRLLRCIRFHHMTNMELLESHHKVKAVDDIVLLYAYCSIVPKLMAENLQDGVNVSSTGPRASGSGQSELAPLLNFLSNQEDASSDVSEFEDDGDIEEEATVQSKKKKLTLKKSMELLQKKVGVRNFGFSEDSQDPYAEFKKLASKRNDLPMDAARQSFNFYKNLDKENLPYDANRVQIWDNCFTDYVNASYIKMDIKGRKKEVRNYIATQDPLKKTTHSFWIMVWQQKVERILMLTSGIECRKMKSKRYWPRRGETETYGKFQVTCTEEVNLSSTLVERTFMLKNLITEEERIITHNQYEGWADNDTRDFLEFLSIIRMQTYGSKTPIVVHCSAGVERTGAFISLDTAWSLMKAKKPVDPLEIIKELRNQRANCVRDVQEYTFICQAILQLYKEELYKQKSPAEKKQSPWRRMFNGLRKTLCSCFVGEKEAKKHDKTNPAWVPTLHLGLEYDSPCTDKANRFQRASQRKEKKRVADAVSSLMSLKRRKIDFSKVSTSPSSENEIVESHEDDTSFCGTSLPSATSEEESEGYGIPIAQCTFLDSNTQTDLIADDIR